MKLILQGTERQTTGYPVYLAVGIRDGKTVKDKRAVLKLLKRLGLGLILVHFLPEGTEPEIIINPGDGKAKPGVNRKKRKALADEIKGRYRDFNTGGSVSSIETMTAYRLNAIRIAVILEKFGPLSPAAVKKHGAAGNVQSILYNNYYGWFTKEKRGIYSLSGKGKKIPGEYPEQTKFLETILNNSNTIDFCT